MTRTQPQDPRPPHVDVSRRSIDVYDAGVLTDIGRRVGSAVAAVDAAKSSPELVVMISSDGLRPDEVSEVASAMGLGTAVIEHLKRGHARPTLERSDRALFMALKSALYIDDAEDVVFSEFHVVVKSNVVLVNRYGGSADVDWTARKFTQHPDWLTMGAPGLLCAILDRVVREYALVVDGLTVDIEQIERQVFSGDSAAPERIYRLSREVIDFWHAAAPLTDVVTKLLQAPKTPHVSARLTETLQVISAELTQNIDKIIEIRDLLDRILTVNASIVGQRQNEDMKRISSWAAILVAPTIIAAIYGMNFDNMPELHWTWGYAASFIAMVAVSLGLYSAFKRRGWL